MGWPVTQGYIKSGGGRSACLVPGVTTSSSPFWRSLGATQCYFYLDFVLKQDFTAHNCKFISFLILFYFQHIICVWLSVGLGRNNTLYHQGAFKLQVQQQFFQIQKFICRKQKGFCSGSLEIHFNLISLFSQSRIIWQSK